MDNLHIKINGDELSEDESLKDGTNLLEICSNNVAKLAGMSTGLMRLIEGVLDIPYVTLV
jgi:hypothetical protein